MLTAVFLFEKSNLQTTDILTDQVANDQEKRMGGQFERRLKCPGAFLVHSCWDMGGGGNWWTRAYMERKATRYERG